MRSFFVALFAAGLACRSETAALPGESTEAKPSKPQLDHASSLPHADPNLHLEFKDGWKIQSSAKLSASAQALSQADFTSSDWIDTSLPTTVLATLAASGAVP